MKTIAVAESLTGGELGAAITSQPGASDFFRGGVIAYANDVKVNLLGVSADVIDTFGAVSQECAVAMASGVRKLCGAEIGIATTGVAGPDSLEGKPVGTVFVALVSEQSNHVLELNLSGNRDQIRAQTTAAAMGLLASPQAG